MKKIKLNNKEGFISIETIIAMSSILFFFIFFIAIFAYNMPRISLEKEVQSLAQIAKIQGGLTDETSEPGKSDIKRFKDDLKAMGYEDSDIQIYAKTLNSKQNAIGVTPISSNGTNYVKRDSKELIELVVKVKADKSVFTAPLKFFGINK